MSAIDRVMIAYNSKHNLTPEMDAMVRRELIQFMIEIGCVDPEAAKVEKQSDRNTVD